MATRNRAQTLGAVLASYAHLQEPKSGWKLIVIDNGSKDETLDVLSSFKQTLPLEVMEEPKPGKNSALNAGLTRIEGDLTVLTDDDAFPHPDWLVQIRKVAIEHPGFSIFGGTILPRWEVQPPSWIRWVTDPTPTYATHKSDPRPGPVFTLTDPSAEDGPISPLLVFGPNMTIRSRIFQSGVCFDTSIGPNGSNYAMGSETELILRLHRQGHRAWHAKGAVVEHFIREEQLTVEWVLRRAIRFGRGCFRMAPNPRQWFGIPRYLLREIPKEAFLMASAALTFRSKARFRAKWRLNYLLGEGYEAFLMARERRALCNPSPSARNSHGDTGERASG
jgi:L-malate glycosyltransferase